jgi:hypothetical protein
MAARITKMIQIFAIAFSKLSGESLSVSSISPINTLNIGSEIPVTNAPKVPNPM